MTSDRSEYLEPTELIFSRYRCASHAAPDLSVHLVHEANFWNHDGHPENTEVLEHAMERIGRRVYVDASRVYVNQFVNYRGLAALCRRNGTSTEFHLIYDQDFIDKKLDLYQSCHQLFGIWPIAAYLASRQSMFFLHGGAATFEGRNIVFCGLQGVGKSTLLLRMLRAPEGKFLSDNIFFHDQEKVYACPETVRLDDASVRFIAPPPGLLRDTGQNSDLNRRMYLADDARTAESFIPDMFLIPRFHPEKSALAPLRPDEDARDLLAVFCELAMELNAYEQWSAPFLMTDGAFATRRQTSLATLLRGKPVYHLHIRKGDSPDAVLDLIRQV